jgi:hypothetical protein
MTKTVLVYTCADIPVTPKEERAACGFAKGVSKLDNSVMVRIGFNADPDPVFSAKADLDPGI